MPITITVNAAEQVRYSVFTGDVTDRELLAVFEHSVQSSQYDGTLNGLVDLRGAERLDISSSGIWALAQVVGPSDRAAHARRVAIVAGTDFQFGMARMAATLLSTGGLSTEYHAFRDLGEARAWLGLAREG
jgi:SpoIIAA-like